MREDSFDSVPTVDPKSVTQDQEVLHPIPKALNLGPHHFSDLLDLGSPTWDSKNVT